MTCYCCATLALQTLSAGLWCATQPGGDSGAIRGILALWRYAAMCFFPDEVTCTNPQVLYSSQHVCSALDAPLNTVNNNSRDANAISSTVGMNASPCEAQVPADRKFT
jgi:hypothetical protein